MRKSTSRYTQTVQITEDYLGPAGERFIRRQSATHLKIEPESLDRKHLAKLIDWSSIAFALMTNNDKDIDAFTQDLRHLTGKGE